MSKLISIIVIILLVVVGVVFVLPRFVTKSPSAPTSQSGLQHDRFTNQEYGFTVDIPNGWIYRETGEKIGNTILVVEFVSSDEKITVPIFVENKNWEDVIAQVNSNFKPETISELTLAGQSAIKVVSSEEETNPGYIYRIKHPEDNLVLLGTAVLIGGGDVKTFNSEVESVLNSIRFE